jgi:hypothetical protein
MMMPKGSEWSRKSYDHLRTVRFAPYRKGAGPTFVLDTWDANTYDHHGKAGIAYRLVMVTDGKREILFWGDRSNGRLFWHPLCRGTGIDHNDTIRGLMGFLTLRPGDTDDDYFADYSAEQIDYAEQHAEALGLAVYDRYGEG